MSTNRTGELAHGLPTPAAVLAPRRIRAGAATSTRSAASRSGPSLPAPAARLHLREGAPPRTAAGPARSPPTRTATGPAALLPHSSGGAPSGLRRHDSTCARARLRRRRQGRCARLPRAQRRDRRRSWRTPAALRLRRLRGISRRRGVKTEEFADLSQNGMVGAENGA